MTLLFWAVWLLSNRRNGYSDACRKFWSPKVAHSSRLFLQGTIFPTPSFPLLRGRGSATTRGLFLPPLD